MIDTVISDLGKVVLWFDNRIFYRQMAASTPFSEEKVREVAHANWNLIELFDTGKITPQEFYSRVVTGLKAKISFEDFFTIYCDVFSLNTPVLEILKNLKPKYKLVLCSNTDVMRFSFIKKNIPEILIFDDYILSFEVGCMKPDLKIYQEALKRAKTEAEGAVFVDDLEENIRGAEKAGIKGILFKPGLDLVKEFRTVGLSF